jgi:hypothetical protein
MYFTYEGFTMTRKELAREMRVTGEIFEVRNVARQSPLYRVELICSRYRIAYQTGGSDPGREGNDTFSKRRQCNQQCFFD